MTDIALSPEAFGTLMAMKQMGKIRLFDQSVADELTGRGLAELKGGTLVVTDAGKAAHKAFKNARELAKREPPKIEKPGKGKKKTGKS